LSKYKKKEGQAEEEREISTRHEKRKFRGGGRGKKNDIAPGEPRAYGKKREQTTGKEVGGKEGDNFLLWPPG